MEADLVVRNGIVHMVDPTLAIIHSGDGIVRRVEVPAEIMDDFWIGKWSYDGKQFAETGAERPELPTYDVLPPSLSDKVDALEAELLGSYMAQAELYERTLALEAENVSNMMAMAEMYEILIGGM